MSFNFFFSDGDDSGADDELDLDALDDTGLLALASRERAERSAAAAPASASPPAAAAAAATVDNDGDGDVDDVEGSDGGDWDNVDWEDADDGEESADDDEAPPAFPTQGVMIKFGKKGKSNDPDEGINADKPEGKEDERGPAKKRKRKTTRVLRSVPHETRRLILDVRRSDMLCSAARCVQQSSICGGVNVDESDERWLLSNLACSLIPPEFHESDATTHSQCKSPPTPTKDELRQFARWFFPWVNQAGRRRRDAWQRNVARGAAAARPRRRRRSARKGTDNADASPIHAQRQTNCHSVGNVSTGDLVQTLTVLSPHYDEDPQLSMVEIAVDAIDAVERITSQEKVLLFLVMARSLGWRARYVTALSPIPLDLTVDHPLLALDGSKSTAKSPPEDRMLQKLLGLMHQSGMIKNATGGSGRKRKKPRKNAKSARAVDAIDLLSSDDADDAKAGKKGKCDKPPQAEGASGKKTASNGEHASQPGTCLLSWVEVLCRSDGSERRSMSSSKPAAKWVPVHPEQESFDSPEDVESILALRESTDSAASKRTRKTSDKPRKSPSTNMRSKKVPVSYVLAVEHPPLSADGPAANVNGRQSQMVRFTDVTPRYASAWSRTLRLRGASGKQITAGGGKCVDEWWETSLKRMNGHFRPKTDRKSPPKTKSPVSVTKAKTASGKIVDVLEIASSEDEKKGLCPDSSDSDEHERIEAKELTGSIEQEKIPTSKAAFKRSPFYVVPSVLNSQDVLHPDARKRICGVFKGEMVYRRSDVSKALRAKKWLYQGRKVKEDELTRPVKEVKARKKPTAKGFKALTSYGVSEEAQEDLISSLDEKLGEERGMDALYGHWQTEPWIPPYVGPSDPIPTNDYKNVELALLNPGLTHLDLPRLAGIARKLGIPYAPCLMGYEGHGGNRTPTIRGIVVHDHNVALLREAHVEWESHAAEKAAEERRREILRRWKRLVVGLLTKERLDREYG